MGIEDLHPPLNTVDEQTATTAKQQVSRELIGRSALFRIRAFLDGFGGCYDNAMNVDSAIILLSLRQLAGIWSVIGFQSRRVGPMLALF
ncbi:MAG TPA: hypothetical protein DDZ51_22920 [Planctomycetaceae bacterium]|nr:hypothetical protein [Planctomycetaceae bacterium]